jgi:hypothetical protein
MMLLLNYSYATIEFTSLNNSSTQSQRMDISQSTWVRLVEYILKYLKPKNVFKLGYNRQGVKSWHFADSKTVVWMRTVAIEGIKNLPMALEVDWCGSF